MHTKPITLWDRFQILFCAEGRDLRECYDILDEEGFSIGKWTSFRGKFYQRPEKDAWIKANIESRNLRLSLENIQESITKIALDGLLRYRYQLSQKPEITIEEIKDLVRLAGEVLGLTLYHPKYNTRQTVGVIKTDAGIPWHPAVQIVYKTLMKFPEIVKFLENPISNREFIQELERETRKVKKGEEILEVSPKLIQGKEHENE